MLFFLLFSILKPSTVNSSTTKRRKWKPSIADSREAVILHLTEVNDLEKRTGELRENFLKKGLKFQPLMVVIGEDLHKLTDFFL